MTAHTTTTVTTPSSPSSSSGGRRKSAWELREEAKHKGWEKEQKQQEHQKTKKNEPQQNMPVQPSNDDNDENKNNNETNSSNVVKKTKKVWKRPKTSDLPPAFQMAFDTHKRLSSSKSITPSQKEEELPEDLVVEIEADDIDEDNNGTRKIRFDKFQRIRHIHPKSDYTHEEKFAYWFQDHEFDRMKKRDRSILKKVARGDTNGRNYCLHGLMDDAYREERRIRIDDTVYNVLTEQENQRQKRDMKRSLGLKTTIDDYCWDSISDLCHDHSQSGLDIAQERALNLSMEMKVCVRVVDMGTRGDEERKDNTDDDATAITTSTTDSIDEIDLMIEQANQ